MSSAGKSPGRAALREGGPPSSPRLPSPPPLPELQLGPRSPSINAPGGDLSLDNERIQDDGAARRVRPGTSAADMARGPPFVPLHQLESPFQLQEYLKSSYSNVTQDESSDTVKPITKESAMQLAAPPIQQDTGEPVDRNLWLYELCRFLVQRTNRLIVSFFADSPPCSSQTCPEMRASEWQYLCAVHEPPKSCCAIDYCCHTLDWAANVLTSTKHFPSRLSLGGEGGSAYQSMRQLTNIFRRVYRIYAHAWFQHREAFWILEQEEGLYKFFRTVCDAYALIPEDNYTIPPEAEGDREDMLETPISQGRPEMQILRNDAPASSPQRQAPPSEATEPDPSPTNQSTQSTAPTVQRRHRHTPSTGTSVNPIAEGEEDEDGGNLTQISQSVPSESTATSTRQASPPKPARSPRPDHISLTDAKFENTTALEDPTPTPERHGSDPFSDQSKAAVAQAAAAARGAEEEDEPPTPSTVTATKPPFSALSPQTPNPIELPPKSKTPVPPLKTNTPPPSYSSSDEGEVRSPGGGSIRTVGNDILSGLLSHQDDEDDTNPFEKLKGNAAPSSETASTAPSTTEQTSTSATSSESGWSVVENEAEKKEPPTATENQDKEAEKDEDMGEIKLDKVATAIKDEPVDKEDHDAPAPKDDIKEDGTKAEETPSGVV